MQILHFDWLRYLKSIGEIGVIERDPFFRFIPKQIFLQFTFANFIVAFLSD